mmetsp:Transcript_8755/g.25181  ORF Transcript_8755/g.25181 Transcript_8755/m.25181 type:complete len:237 (-) Transcript_8755:934-1644(-)
MLLDLVHEVLGWPVLKDVQNVLKACRSGVPITIVKCLQPLIEFVKEETVHETVPYPLHVGSVPQVETVQQWAAGQSQFGRAQVIAASSVGDIGTDAGCGMVIVHATRSAFRGVGCQFLALIYPLDETASTAHAAIGRLRTTLASNRYRVVPYGVGVGMDIRSSARSSYLIAKERIDVHIEGEKVHSFSCRLSMILIGLVTVGKKDLVNHSASLPRRGMQQAMEAVRHEHLDAVLFR